MQTGEDTIGEASVGAERSEAGVQGSVNANPELRTLSPQTAIPSYTPIVARTKINIRPATLADIPFIDAMQKKHSRELGFLPLKAIEGKIVRNEVLVAERVDSCQLVVASEDGDSVLATNNRQLATPVGYLIAADRYFKRDEIGYVTQINVIPEYRRSLVAAALLQAQFDRSAYGCRLYCCWCAQDLTANEFWEAMGFSAIAFRTGSMKKGAGVRVRGSGNASSLNPERRTLNPRVHIFRQKRIRAGDETTPWWYPSHTGGGEMREDRLVFPIMPGVNWRDVGPVVLPNDECRMTIEKTEDGGPPVNRKSKIANRKSAPPMMRSPGMAGGLWFASEGVPVAPALPAKVEKTEKPKKTKATIDPKLKAMARELRDQWTERVGQSALPSTGKHDVKRIAQATKLQTMPLLESPMERAA